MRRFLSGVIYAASGALGILAFLYPFLLPHTGSGAPEALRGQVAPLLTAALVGLSVLALLIEVQGETLSAKTVALLGVLIAFISVLRFIELAIPVPGGFSPIFAPIILAGYVFGARFGFLTGALGMLVSALMTAGVGPWLPFQMFSAGWAGLTAGWLPHLGKRIDVLILCVFGAIWGMLFGLIMNLYFWPFAMGPVEQTWRQGMSVGETLAHYTAFYVVTSLAWDAVRSAGNAAMLLLIAAPLSRILTRFKLRFHFEASDE
jgi:energy-coupling factor transport system substrate-specific component